MWSRWLKRSGLALAIVCLVGCATVGERSKGPTDTPDHHYAAGQIFLGQEKYSSALAEFERAEALHPNYAPAFEGLALAQLGLRNQSRAEEAADTAKEIDSAYAPGYVASGRVQAAKGNLREAIRDFTHALDINPRYVQAYYYRGKTLMRCLDFDRAERDFDSALQIQPTHKAARSAWERSMKIRLATPGTHIGKKIVLADPITRADLAALIATELGLERALRKHRPELFDPGFRRAVGLRSTEPDLPRITDVESHWAKGFIELVTELSLMEAFPDRTFRPDAMVDRASYAMTIQQVLAIVDNDQGLRSRFIGSVSPFPDVRNDHFAYNAIMVATTRGMLEAQTGTGAFNLTGSMSGADALLGLRKLAELF